MSDGGKGDKRRPEDQEAWDDGYDRIWGNKKRRETAPQESEQQDED